MQTRSIIEQSLLYIEQNLKTDISPEELASIAGYSQWHYCRLFSRAMGTSIAGYIRKRRLDVALMEIGNGRKAAQVVAEYGFDTYAGFYKAFVRLYGCSPKKYLSLYPIHRQALPGGINMHTSSQLRAILSNWDIPKNAKILDIPIVDGTKTARGIWDIDGRFILKTGERAQMRNDIALRKALAAQGLRTTAPLATQGGADCLEQNGSIYTLTPKIPGAPLAKHERFGEQRREWGHKYGQSIARLHAALALVEDGIAPDEAALFPQVSSWALPNVQKQNEQWNMGLPAAFFDDYTQNFGRLYPALPQQLVHRDLHPSNILFENGELSGFIDFTLSEKNLRLWDPCYCATGILSEWRGVDDIHEKWLDILAGILHGYDSQNPLTQEEKQAVYYVLCSIQMICVAYFESTDEYKELAKTNRDMLCFIASEKERINQIF